MAQDVPLVLRPESAVMEITEIVDVGPGWNKVRLADGNVYTLRGDYNWRSNNPGNIEWGDFARSQGAIGSGAPPPGRARGFAIFPTKEAGEQARIALQFESPSYRDRTIASAISRYAPPSENDTQQYIRIVSEAAGVPPSTRMRDLTPDQRRRFLAAQERFEGFREGDIIAADGTRLPPAEIPQVATELDVTPPPVPQPLPPAMQRVRAAGSGQARSLVGGGGGAPTPAPYSQRPQRTAPTPAPASQRPSRQAPHPAPASQRPVRQAPVPAPASQRPQRPAPVPQTMSADLRAQRRTPQQNAAMVADAGVGLTGQRNVTPQLREDGIYTYHVPDPTWPTVTGGAGSLTPDARVAEGRAAPQPAQMSPAMRRVRAATGLDGAPASSLTGDSSARQSYAGQERSPPEAWMNMNQVAGSAGDIPKYVTTTEESGKATRTKTIINPNWVAAQQRAAPPQPQTQSQAMREDRTPRRVAGAATGLGGQDDLYEAGGYLYRPDGGGGYERVGRAGGGGGSGGVRPRGTVSSRPASQTVRRAPTPQPRRQPQTQRRTYDPTTNSWSSGGSRGGGGGGARSLV